MKFKRKIFLSLVCIFCLIFAFSSIAQATPNCSDNNNIVKPAENKHVENQHAKNKHIFGHDRYATSMSIAQELNNDEKVDNIVVASAKNFADALAASTLAAKLNAPIILAGKEYKDTRDNYSYIESHLNAGGTVTIIGGYGVISKSVEQKLISDGFKVVRCGGGNRFDTDALIIKQLDVPEGTPVILANGFNFPDALGVASLAASKGWPILITAPNQIPQAVQDFIASDKPTDVYIVGGNGILHKNLESQIKVLAPDVQITRLGGADRFETLSLVLNKFYPNPAKIYVANGLDFADALSGSTLASQDDAPIILVNPKSNDLAVGIRNYLITLRNNGIQPEVVSLGGDASVPQRILDKINKILLIDQDNSSDDNSSDDNIVVTGVTLDQETMTLTVGDTTGTLKATIEPDDATNQDITWSSSDDSVATVADGVVTPVTAGTATITVTTEDGSKEATCTVTVNNPE